LLFSFKIYIKNQKQKQNDKKSKNEKRLVTWQKKKKTG
jgi:hypothetical protein